MTPVLQLDRLCWSVGGADIIDGVSLAVREGEAATAGSAVARDHPELHRRAAHAVEGCSFSRAARMSAGMGTGRRVSRSHATWTK